MKNILVVGSSHVGSIKRGFDLIDLSSEIKFQYIALPGKKFRKFEVSNKCLVYPQGESKFIQEWFGIVSPPCLDDFYKILFVSDRCRLSLDHYSSDRTIPLLSYSIIHEIVHNVRSSLFLSLIRAIGPSKLIYLGGPLISSSAFENEHISRVPLLNNDDAIKTSCLVGRIRKICRQSEEDETCPSFLLPPPHLLEKHQFNTLDAYIRGGVAIKGNSRAADSNDYVADMDHGNAEYGKEIARHVLGFLEFH